MFQGWEHEKPDESGGLAKRSRPLIPFGQRLREFRKFEK
jgi:hypothetical protein